MQSGRFELGETEQSEVSIQFESGRSHPAVASNVASSSNGRNRERRGRVNGVGVGPRGCRNADPPAAFRNPFVSNRHWSACEPP